MAADNREQAGVEAEGLVREFKNGPRAVDGIDLWNFANDLGETIGSIPAALRLLATPARVMDHPPERNMRAWDELCRTRRVVAIGGLDALREREKRRVPQDISIAGFDDIPIAGWPHYGLTTFRQPLDGIVEVVTGMLEDGSCEPGRPSSIRRLPGQLIVRRSSDLVLAQT